MVKRDLEKEKQLELAAVWGSQVDGDSRFPKRRGNARKTIPVDPSGEEVNVEMDDVPSDVDSVTSEIDGAAKSKVKKAKKSHKERRAEYRLHCFVEPGTEVNAVRTVFEAYEPKVSLRTSQKGNLLNKTQFAVLTFRNKAMAMHAVQTLDGTNQRDLLGVKSLKIGMMLSRYQSKMVRKKVLRKMKRDREHLMTQETEEDINFVRQFIDQHTTGRKK